MTMAFSGTSGLPGGPASAPFLLKFAGQEVNLSRKVSNHGSQHHNSTVNVNGESCLEKPAMLRVAKR